MINQFSRTEILLGEDAMKKLASSRVAIFGIGGVGGYTAEALARCGIGTLDLIDNDNVSLTNLNRQIIALHSTIGQPKVEVAMQRILDINPNININIYNKFYTKENSCEFDFSNYDYVVDAIDTVSSKIELILKAQEKSVSIISSMGAGNKLNPAMFEVSDIYKTSVCPLAKVMRQELKKHKVKHLKVVYSKEIPIKPEVTEEVVANKKYIAGSTAFVPPTVGLIIASEVVKDIICEDNK